MFKKAFSHPPNPTRAETRAFPWQGRSEREPEAYRGPVALSDATGDTYVEGSSDAIDPLQLQEQRVPGWRPFSTSCKASGGESDTTPVRELEDRQRTR